jgi:hypothetical protein
VPSFGRVGISRAGASCPEEGEGQNQHSR